MAAATAAKPNIKNKAYGNYFSAPITLFRRGTTSSAFIGGLISSYSGKERENGEKSVCRRTYDKLCEQLQISYSTVWRGLKSLTDKFVKKVQRSGYVFEAQDSAADELFLRFEDFLFIERFRINGVKRYLTNNERAVAALIFTLCDNGKTCDNACTLAHEKIAAILGLCEKTVRKALEVLMLKSVRLVIQDESEKGVNGHKIGTYHFNSKRLRNVWKARKKAEAAGKETGIKAKRAEAEAKAESNLNRALQDKTFKEAYGRHKAAEINSIRATAKGDVKAAQELDAEAKRQRRIWRREMRRMGFKEEDFKAKTICVHCGDTGYDKDGKPCEVCSARPPRFIQEEIAGELNND